MSRLGILIADIVFLAGLAVIISWSLQREGRDPVFDRERAVFRVVGRTFDIHDASKQAPWLLNLMYVIDGVDHDRNRSDAVLWLDEHAKDNAATNASCALTYARKELLLCREASFPAGWFADQAIVNDDTSNSEQLRAAKERAFKRGDVIFRRLAGFHALNIALIVFGLIAIRPFARQRHAFSPLGWPGGVGVLGLLSCFLIGIALTLATMTVVSESLPVRAMCAFLLTVLGVLSCSLPKKKNISLFDHSRFDVLQSVTAILAVTGTTLLGETFIQWFFQLLGRPVHWSQWYNEQLVFGSGSEIFLLLITSCVFSPFVEEIVFRGILYSVLRRRFGVGAGVVLSALIFGLAHGSDLPTMLSLAWCGMVWAFSYERTGRLSPAIVAHSLNNLFYALSVVLFLR